MNARWLIPLGIVAVIVVSGCSTQSTSPSQYPSPSYASNDIGQQINIIQKLRECASICSGKNKDIPAVYDTYYSACHDVYYNAGLKELEDFVAGCV